MPGGHADERGAGLISTASGVVVFLMFLLFAVQLLFSLYASSTVSAVTSDAAHRAAARGAPPLPVIEAEARSNLGRVGEGAAFDWATVDTDRDGADDTLVLEVVAAPPRVVPRSLGGTLGLGEIRRTVRVRLEELQR